MLTLSMTNISLRIDFCIYDNLIFFLFQDLQVMNMKRIILFDVMPYSPVEVAKVSEEHTAFIVTVED
jgi:hypothetical protein